MKTQVVNLRVDSYDVYIGRPGRNQSGEFGNPYSVGELCSRCGLVHTNGESTLPCFKAYFEERLKNDLAFKLAVLDLDGKTLGCFCTPHPCHGDVVVAWLESF